MAKRLTEEGHAELQAVGDQMHNAWGALLSAADRTAVAVEQLGDALGDPEALAEAEAELDREVADALDDLADGATRLGQLTAVYGGHLVAAVVERLRRATQ